MLTRRKLAMALILGVAALTILNYQSARAWTLWYVVPGGNNLWNCQSVATACRTIQAAVNKAASGDSIRVEAGTYSASTNGEIFPITISKSLIIFGVSYATTILDATGSGQHIFSAGGNNIFVYISSFTLQGGNRAIEYIGYYPGYIGGLINNNVINNNVIGIYTNDSRGDITQNSFSGNTIHAILNEYSTPSIKQNVFGWNGSGGTSAAIYNDHSTPVIVNNLIGWNNGSGVFNSHSSPVITNNTIYWNWGGSGVGNFDSSSPQITNNIITSNYVYGIHAQNASSPTNTHNDVWGNGWGGYADYYGTGAGTGSISQDPRFTSLLDAHLLCSSPAINAGNNSAPSVPSVDYDGNPRPVGGRVDMGALEKQTNLFCPTYLPLIRK